MKLIKTQELELLEQQRICKRIIKCKLNKNWNNTGTQPSQPLPGTQIEYVQELV